MRIEHRKFCLFPVFWETYRFTQSKLSIGGSKRGGRLWVQILSISCSFGGKLVIIKGGRPHLCSWQPLLWKILDPPLLSFNTLSKNEKKKESWVWDNKVQCSGGSRISQIGGANFQGGVANLLFGQIFTENCIKLKEFGPRGGNTRPWCLVKIRHCKV